MSLSLLGSFCRILIDHSETLSTSPELTSSCLIGSTMLLYRCLYFVFFINIQLKLVGTVDLNKIHILCIRMLINGAISPTCHTSAIFLALEIAGKILTS